MARERELSSGASGRIALATFRDDDFEDFVAAVHYCPILAADRGMRVAMAFWRTQVRSLVALFRLARPESREAAFAMKAINHFYMLAIARLGCESTLEGFNLRNVFIEVVENELFETGARAVFERSAPSETKAYTPHIPTSSEA